MEKEKYIQLFRLSLAIVFIIGVACVLIGLVFVNNQMDFINKASSADGIIIGIKENRGDNSITFRPVVQFQLLDGRRQMFISKVGSNSSSFKVGSAVKVLYDSENPQSAEIDSFETLWLFQAVVLFLGTIFIAITIYFRNKKSLGASYSIEFSGKEIGYLLFSKKVCPACNGTLAREKKKIDLGIGPSTWDGIDGTMYTYGQWYKVKYIFRCSECGKIFDLKRLVKMKM